MELTAENLLTNVHDSLNRIATAQWIHLLYTESERAELVRKLIELYEDHTRADTAWNDAENMLRAAEAKRAEQVTVVDAYSGEHGDPSKLALAVSKLDAMDVELTDLHQSAASLFEESKSTKKRYEEELRPHPLIAELVTKGRYFHAPR